MDYVEQVPAKPENCGQNCWMEQLVRAACIFFLSFDLFFNLWSLELGVALWNQWLNLLILMGPFQFPWVILWFSENYW